MIEKQIHTPEDDDLEAIREQESRLPSAPKTYTDEQLDGFKIEDPVRLLSIYHEKIREGKESLYAWQVRVLMKFAEPVEYDADGKVMVRRVSVRANNGSGKSQFTIAPSAVWLCMAFKKARAVVTSASGTQLDRQVGRALINLCQSINELHGCMLWKCNYRSLTFLPTKSTIELYATDDPGKAEGYHPHDTGTEFALFIDEAKSVEETIFEAISRCTGMTRRMDVSSPKNPKGHFYTTCGPNNLRPGILHRVGRWWTIRVTYRECPHVSLDELEEAKDRYGETSSWFLSAYEAMFSSVNEELVMTWEQLQEALKNPPAEILEGAAFAGLDLAAGGDENVLSVWCGNTQIGLEAFRYDDTTKATDHIKMLMRKYKLLPENVNADDGGVGKAMLDQLARDGYEFKRVRNESKPRNSLLYGNRGAELWFNYARLLKEGQLVLLDDAVQTNQLSSRYYKKSEPLGRLILESKKMARSKGHGSPDRADATILAFAGKGYPLYKHITAKSSRSTRSSADALIEMVRQEKYQYSGIDTAINNKSRPLLVRGDYSQLKAI